MKKCYPVFFCDQNVGAANISVCGLYMQISCNCRLPDQKIYKLYAQCNGSKIPLGVMVPKNGVFVLEKRIPVKNFEDTEMRFVILQYREVSDENAYFVLQNKPFAQLAELTQNAFLQEDTGKIKIVIPTNRQ